ncbi:MAG: wax ester/triacylglycerol synthase family O-acyltransferase [Pyrinomonadaceae bacterium]|nr:wax ester/triacylglycerol synthase family O-acyltransferase [Pyrinomonadaceae bacterium]
MGEPKLNRRMTSLDATFLYLEKKECPMHIGSTSVFEGALDLATLKQHISDRLHLIPRYTQKVVPDPFNIAHPTWEDDPEFDIDNHISEIETDGPVGDQELTDLAGEKLSGVMNRDMPLWELFLIPELANGNSAMIAKVHHCMVDGISGVDLMKVLFDISPQPEPAPPKSTKASSPPLLDPTRQFFDSLLGSMEEGMNRFMEMQAGMLYLASSVADPSNAEKIPQMAGVLPAVGAPPPLLPFNKPCSGVRRLAWSEFPFSDARKIKNEMGGTVNDVVLTVLSESVARYSVEHDFDVEGKIVRFMVPVSLRQKDKRGSMGNLISILPVEIPLDIYDFQERFNFINEKTGIMKSTRLAESFLTLGAMYSMIPAPLQSAIGQVADTPVPPFNMVATNVPGPQIPLYLAGRKLLKQYPYVPIGYGLGLGCAIFSYNRMLYFGLSSDAQAMDDVERFKEIVDSVFEELLGLCVPDTKSANG